MVTVQPVEVYCSVPIYLKQIDRRTFWLQWQHHEIFYGVPLTDPQEAIDRARMMIDAMLGLEARELRLQERSHLRVAAQERIDEIASQSLQHAMAS
ncbi:MAG: hypothetical protein SFW36_04195 [Leptolyngbyaceae cyanobacterium bins.59]|nr:hypothetical protein [Leptolyngbyaceae cyanobacterium bins.59]